ncbi:MAG: AmmeMemoRadiSam system radical SAM enzyme [Actinobacteria bacterium]|nr:MAG: AmmeMemoRadiSam system radical SAM enzyme [Actinomycetota bacterium]
MREGLLWEVEGERVHCLLCPHDCRIAPGHTGVCGVREARDGALVPLTYGLVSSAAVDPIEKKPVFHFRPGTKAFSLGSVGCTMRCSHCQNWQISRATPDDGGLRMLMPEEAVRLAGQYGCEGIAFTYNEPVVWIEYVLDTARLAKDAGLYTVMVTNGYITRAGLDTIGEVIDVWRVDVKAFDDRAYRSLCKVRSVQPVLEMAARAKKTWQMHVEVVTNVIPTINDDEASLRGIAAWIASDLGPDTPWHITRFFPYVELAHLPPTPISTLKRAVEIGAEEGLHFVFLGNVSDPGGEDTRCPSCGVTAVARDGYLIAGMNLDDDGGCADCGRPLGIHV